MIAFSGYRTRPIISDVLNNFVQHKAAGVSDSNGAGGPVAVTYQMLASSVADFHHL